MNAYTVVMERLNGTIYSPPSGKDRKLKDAEKIQDLLALNNPGANVYLEEDQSDEQSNDTPE